MLYQSTTDQILKCFFKVYNTLGYGFLEKVYERAFLIELRKQGLLCSSQIPTKVYYEQELIGEYFADILVLEKIILELKAAECLVEEHEVQLVNYLRATNIEVGLLLNFGKKPEIRRKLYTNELKQVR